MATTNGCSRPRPRSRPPAAPTNEPGPSSWPATTPHRPATPLSPTSVSLPQPLLVDLRLRSALEQLELSLPAVGAGHQAVRHVLWVPPQVGCLRDHAMALGS